MANTNYWKKTVWMLSGIFLLAQTLQTLFHESLHCSLGQRVEYS